MWFGKYIGHDEEISVCECEHLPQPKIEKRQEPSQEIKDLKFQLEQYFHYLLEQND